MLAEHQNKMKFVRATHPDWFDFFEDHDPDTCDRATLQQLIETAPTDYARGLCAGKLSLRIQLALVTGRPFN